MLCLSTQAIGGQASSVPHNKLGLYFSFNPLENSKIDPLAILPAAAYELLQRKYPVLQRHTVASKLKMASSSTKFAATASAEGTRRKQW